MRTYLYGWLDPPPEVKAAQKTIDDFEAQFPFLHPPYRPYFPEGGASRTGTIEYLQEAERLAKLPRPKKRGAPRKDALGMEAAQMEKEGRSRKEIAEHQGTSTDAVRKRIERFEKRQTTDSPDKNQNLILSARTKIPR